MYRETLDSFSPTSRCTQYIVKNPGSYSDYKRVLSTKTDDNTHVRHLQEVSPTINLLLTITMISRTKTTCRRVTKVSLYSFFSFELLGKDIYASYHSIIHPTRFSSCRTPLYAALQRYFIFFLAATINWFTNCTVISSLTPISQRECFLLYVACIHVKCFYCMCSDGERE